MNALTWNIWKRWLFFFFNISNSYLPQAVQPVELCSASDHGVQRILGYGRPQRIGVVCPPRAGERRPRLEDRPSNVSWIEMGQIFVSMSPFLPPRSQKTGRSTSLNHYWLIPDLMCTCGKLILSLSHSFFQILVQESHSSLSQWVHQYSAALVCQEGITVPRPSFTHCSETSLCTAQLKPAQNIDGPGRVSLSNIFQRVSGVSHEDGDLRWSQPLHSAPCSSLAGGSQWRRALWFSQP